jgi:hypothetical protein
MERAGAKAGGAGERALKKRGAGAEEGEKVTGEFSWLDARGALGMRGRGGVGTPAGLSGGLSTRENAPAAAGAVPASSAWDARHTLNVTCNSAERFVNVSKKTAGIVECG